MRAMVCEAVNRPLVAVERAVPEPGPGQVLIRVAACAVCRTDLHLVDGELADPRLPVIPGHEIVGRVAALGAGVERFQLGQRVGVPWLGWTCGRCGQCRAGRENLCAQARFTGCHIDGGYAEFALADARYTFALPDGPEDAAIAPWLCAGLIGWRTLKLAGEGQRLGIYGFGAAAHIVAQVARWQGRTVFAFTRPGDTAGQDFARRHGAHWAGDSTTAPPEPLDAALIFAPVGALVPLALAAVRPGGSVVCGGIHMSDIPGFPYRLLWEERRLLSVANLTRADGEEFLGIAVEAGVSTEVEPMPLAEANRALDRLRSGALTGAAVLIP
jgi:alcohol dehydrogenase, propanol-preferring